MSFAARKVPPVIPRRAPSVAIPCLPYELAAQLLCSLLTSRTARKEDTTAFANQALEDPVHQAEDELHKALCRYLQHSLSFLANTDKTP